MGKIKGILTTNDDPVICKKCGGKMLYKHAGIYECESCKEQELDDFGRIKQYIEEHGPTSAVILAEETGVSTDKITQFLKAGRVEIPQGSNVFIKCEKCGCDIRFGRFCPECAAGSGEKRGFFNEVGERPKGNGSGEMRFLNR